MAITRVQHTNPAGTSAASTTSVTSTLPAAATAGNIIIGACGVDKVAGIWAPPAGSWFDAGNQSSTSVSMWVGWMVAAGGETALTLGWSTVSPAGATFWLGEYADDAAGDWRIFGSAFGPTNEASDTVQSTGPTRATDAIGQGLAFFAIDSGTSGTNPSTYSASFTALVPYVTGGRAGLSVAERADIPAGTSVDVEETHGPTIDQVIGAVIVFGRSARNPASAYAMEAMWRGNHG